jgi:hypothetical protein
MPVDHGPTSGPAGFQSMRTIARSPRSNAVGGLPMLNTSRSARPPRNPTGWRDRDRGIPLSQPAGELTIESRISGLVNHPFRRLRRQPRFHRRRFLTWALGALRVAAVYITTLGRQMGCGNISRFSLTATLFRFVRKSQFTGSRVKYVVVPTVLRQMDRPTEISHASQEARMTRRPTLERTGTIPAGVFKFPQYVFDPPGLLSKEAAIN